MKPFLSYLKPRVVAPAREVADYSTEERRRLREAFSSVAANYRRQERTCVWGFAGFAGSIVLAVILPTAWLPWSAIPVAICFAFFFFAMIGMAGIVCPGCSNEIENSFGCYCPECGSRQLQRNGWYRAPHCTACGKRMRRGRARMYTIRACTHCGLMLDEEGF